MKRSEREVGLMWIVGGGWENENEILTGLWVVMSPNLEGHIDTVESCVCGSVEVSLQRVQWGVLLSDNRHNVSGDDDPQHDSGGMDSDWMMHCMLGWRCPFSHAGQGDGVLPSMMLVNRVSNKQIVVNRFTVKSVSFKWFEINHISMDG